MTRQFVSSYTLTKCVTKTRLYLHIIFYVHVRYEMYALRCFICYVSILILQVTIIVYIMIICILPTTVLLHTLHVTGFDNTRLPHTIINI